MELGTLSPGSFWDMSKLTLQSQNGQEAPSQQILEIQIHQQLTKQLDSKPGRGECFSTNQQEQYLCFSPEGVSYCSCHQAASTAAEAAPSPTFYQQLQLGAVDSSLVQPDYLLVSYPKHFCLFSPGTEYNAH